MSRSPWLHLLVRGPSKREGWIVEHPDEPDEPRFAETARAALGDTASRGRLRQDTARRRAARASAVAELPDWEELREAGARQRDAVLYDLEARLLQLEAEVTAAGGTLHWARDAADAAGLISRLEHDAASSARLPGPLLAELDLIPAESSMPAMAPGLLAAHPAIPGARSASEGVPGGAPGPVPRGGPGRSGPAAAPETVAGGTSRPLSGGVPELMADGAPGPAAGSPEQVAEGSSGPAAATPEVVAGGASGPAAGTLELAAGGASGSGAVGDAELVVVEADAVVAESGTVVVLGAEAVRGVARAATVVAVAGLDQVLGDWAELEVWLQLRARSAGERLGRAMATLCGAVPGDDPRSFHLVLVDGGRTDALADPSGRTALRCIGCAACADVCPVYERVGDAGYPGHRAGPAGAVRTPLLEGTRGTAAASLPFASTLCGACGDVCPVGIDLPELLLELRGRVVDERRANPLPGPELLAMQGLEWVLGDAGRMETAQRAGTRWARLLGRTGRIRRLPGLLSRWTDARDLPVPPRETFRAWWRGRRR